MSLNYARELLKVSISQICDAIGFDTTSEVALDILVDVCERQLQCLARRTANLIQLDHRYQMNFFDILTILFDNNCEDFHHLHDFMEQFQCLRFSQDIVQFPYRKRNQFCLRIPPKDSSDVIERDQNQTTDYIYDWLPLFPDQETPEHSTSVNIDSNFDATVYPDQQKKLDKSDSHHPLTLLSLLSKNGDATTIPTAKPVGKRPNQSLPSVLYRPRRVIELEVAAAAVAAAEKARKEQLEKENNEKEQQQGPPPPLRLTIPRPPVIPDKAALVPKKLPASASQPTIVSSLTATTTTTSITTTTATTAATATLATTMTTTTTPIPTPAVLPSVTSTAQLENNQNKKGLNTFLLPTYHPSVNLGSRLMVSPPIISSKEPQSQSNLPTNYMEPSPNLDKVNDGALDLSIKSNTTTTPPPPPPAKLPTLKIKNLKNSSGPQITNNSEMPPTATKKIQRQTTSTKAFTGSTNKINLTIRTSSVPLHSTTETGMMISPPLNVKNEDRLDPIEASIDFSRTVKDDKTPIVDIADSLVPTDKKPAQNKTNENNQKQKKKKKVQNDAEDKADKKLKKEPNINPVESQQDTLMDIDPIPVLPPNPTPLANTSSGGAIRLKIKLGKPSTTTSSTTINQTVDQITTTTTDSEPRPPPDVKPQPLRLTLPKVHVTSQATRPPDLTHASNTPTISRRKSSKVKREPQKSEINIVDDMSTTTNITFLEDNTLSVDDVPLGERTSPNKAISINEQTVLPQQIVTTPIKKKSNAVKKKSSNKRTNNTVGVAVIEERRINHDSQEKIWICPSCDRPDNGQEAMIACDLCDDWYHWECVGIVEEPPESIPWFCPKCHGSNSSTTSTQGIKPSASSKAKRKRASALYQQKEKEQKQSSSMSIT